MITIKISNTSNRLKELMTIRDLKQVDILNKLQPLCSIYNVKFNKSDLSQYVSGKTEPNQDKLFILSKALDVDVAWLMGFDVPIVSGATSSKLKENSYPLSDREYTHITKYRKLDTISRELVDLVIDKELERSTNDYTLNDNVVDFGSYKEIPCYPRLASAGTGEYLFDDIPTNTIKIDTREYPRADYAIQVNGDSMEPTYYDGDTLIVERNAIPEIGKTGIFIVDGASYVKRMGNGELISDNKSYDSIVGEYGKCLGRVLGKV